MSKILVINSGSSSIKFKVFDESLKEEVNGIVERIGISGTFLEVKEVAGRGFVKQKFPGGLKSHQVAFSEIIKRLKKYLPEINRVGHRIVHGGEKFTETIRLGKTEVEQIEKFNNLAPLHNPINLACVKKALELIPDARHYGVFDTAYYKTIPDYAYLYPLPLELYKKYQIRRYGFHGTSHQYVVGEAAKKIKKDLAGLKIISCHLGSGCSVTATEHGQAIATTMGFTPLEGLMMSTRSGDIDPSIPLFLIEQAGMSTKEVSELLNKKSGLLGIAGSMDMREILSAAGKKVVDYKVEKIFNKEQKEKSILALNMFVYNIVRYIGQFMAVMGGADLIVFTGGVGERSPVIKQMIMRSIKPLGNFKGIVIPANEELMIAREVNNSK